MRAVAICTLAQNDTCSCEHYCARPLAGPDGSTVGPWCLDEGDQPVAPLLSLHIPHARNKRAGPARCPHITGTRAWPPIVSATSNGHTAAGGRAQRGEKLRKESSIVARLEEEHACELHNSGKWMRQQEVQVKD